MGFRVGFLVSEGIHGVVGFLVSEGIHSVVGFLVSEGIHSVVGFLVSEGIHSIVGFLVSEVCKGITMGGTSRRERVSRRASDRVEGVKIIAIFDQVNV